MNRRFVMVLGGVFALLTIIALLQSRQAALPAEETVSLSFIGRELNMTVNDIQAIRLRDLQTNQVFIISRDSNENWIAPESEGSLDAEAASNIAKTMVLMPYERTIAVDNSTNLSQYGFSTGGTLAAEILLKNNSSHAIAVGGLTPTGLQYYTLIDELPRLFFIERGAIDYLLALVAKPPLT